MDLIFYHHQKRKCFLLLRAIIYISYAEIYNIFELSFLPQKYLPHISAPIS